MAKDIAARYRIKSGTRVALSAFDPADTAGVPDKEAAKKQIKRNAKVIDALQDRLYAERTRALLVILQGVDTSGKDGTIRKVFNRTGPLGVAVTAFRRPSEEELAHDFLWRAHLACPRRGTIGIFNRSHYEDVLAARVRKLAPPKTIEARYDQINGLEKILSDNGTMVLKFMLHVSKDEQAKRLQKRIDEPKSRWKFDPADIEDRKHWDDYQRAYEIMLARCTTDWAPWHVIPADHKWARNAAIAAIVRATLEAMDPKYPKPEWDPKEFKIV